VIRNGTLYDGSGRDPVHGDLAIDGDRISAVGTVQGRGRTEIDAHGLAVSPGFINVMSQSTESLIADGRGMSDLMQGVTTEILGEGDASLAVSNHDVVNNGRDRRAVAVERYARQ